MLRRRAVPLLVAVIAVLLGAVVALAIGNNSTPSQTASAPADTGTSSAVPVSVPTTATESTRTKAPATTQPSVATTAPPTEETTSPAMPGVVKKGEDGYTYLFNIVGFKLGDGWKVVQDTVYPTDRVFVVSASCEDYVGHCRGIAVVNKVNAPVNIRLTDESTAIQLAGNTDPANRCYSDGGLHDNTWYQYPYNDGSTKFGNRDLQHRIHKVCGRDGKKSVDKERMHSWETDDVLIYDTDMANPGLGEDLLGVFAGARWI